MQSKSTAKENCTSRITRSPWRLVKVIPMLNYTLKVEFMDGTQGLVEMKNFIMSEKAGVFSILKDVKIFNQVYLKYGVATWPNEIDLAPDRMYQEIRKKGVWLMNASL